MGIQNQELLALLIINVKLPFVPPLSSADANVISHMRPGQTWLLSRRWRCCEDGWQANTPNKVWRVRAVTHERLQIDPYLKGKVCTLNSLSNSSISFYMHGIMVEVILMAWWQIRIWITTISFCPRVDYVLSNFQSCLFGMSLFKYQTPNMSIFPPS